ncbi:MAG: hypothetical protein WCG06_00230 [Candidatus Omnitrophota bacterium]
MSVKVIAALVVVSFIAQDLSYAAIDLTAKKTVDASDFHVPQNLGVIKEAVSLGSPQTVINIKDIHDNFSAQESIVGLLETLVANYQIQTVGVEGMEGFVDTSLVAALPDEKLRRSTAGYMMKEGYLSAGEFFSAMSGGRIGLFGMDDNRLYEENLAAYKKAYEEKKNYFTKIESLQKLMGGLEEAVYSPELLELNHNGVLVTNGQIKFSQRWKAVAALADKYGIAYDTYANIGALLKALEAEKAIDFNKVNDERQTLLDMLSKKLPKDALEKLVEQSVLYKLGRISQASYSSYLLSAAGPWPEFLAASGNLIRYSGYMMIYESLDVEALKDEVSHVEDKIRQKLFQNDDQRQLYGFVHQLSVVSDLFDLKLSSGSLEFFKAHRAEFDGAALGQFLAKLCAKHRLAPAPEGDIAAIFAQIPEFMKFYEAAEKRNHALLNNTIESMRKNGQNVGCLITGGFHSRGISALLREGRMSYVVILPRYSKKSERPYLTVLVNQAQSYRDFVESEQVLTAKLKMTAHYFAQVAFAALVDAGVPEIRLFNRTAAKAEALAADIGGPIRIVDTSDVAGTALLVNTTSLGMAGQPPLDLDLTGLPPAAIVTDIVYTPLITPLLLKLSPIGRPPEAIAQV